MRAQNITPSNSKTIANELATKANKLYGKAKEAHRKHLYYAHKLAILRDNLLNSPWLLFTVLYIVLLVIDAVFMKPIIQTLVQHGFKLESEASLYLFIGIYIVLVTALTLIVAEAFGKELDHKLRDLQVNLEHTSKPGTAMSVIEDEIREEEHRKIKFGSLALAFLILTLALLSLYRNYIVNEFQIRFDSPDDWTNTLIPILLGLGLCYLGIYKDVVVKLLRFKSKTNKYQALRDNNQDLSDMRSRQALEQDTEAKKKGETMGSSKEFLMMSDRYANLSCMNPDMLYAEKREVIVIISVKGEGAPDIQVSALTADNGTILTTTDTKGEARLLWSTESDSLTSIKIGRYDLVGSSWLHGQMITVDLEDFITKHHPESTDKNYLKNRLPLHKQLETDNGVEKQAEKPV